VARAVGGRWIVTHRVFVRIGQRAVAALFWLVGVPVWAANTEIVLKLERSLGAGRAPVSVPKADLPTFAVADRIDGQVDQRTVLKGHAEVRRGGTVLRGDQIDYSVHDDVLVATGATRAFGDGLILSGERLELKLDAYTGRMPDVDYVYVPRQGRGQAALLELLGAGRSRLTDATYTTCTPDDQAWWVQAQRLDIDRENELAKARGARLYFKGVPVLASPYFQMPLGDKRRSGVLTPSFGLNSRLGAEVTVPLYWNMAPNYDLTVAPRAMARRGVLLQNELRYLQPSWRGVIEYDGIAKDRDVGGARERFSARHEQVLPQVFGGGLGVGYNYNYVTDDRFFVDFGRNVVSASAAVLPQEAWMTYGRGIWNSSLRVSKNQTLLSLLATGELPPYERVPQFTVGASAYDWSGFDLGLAVEATHFEQRTPVATAPSGREPGTRYIVNPSVSYPWLAPGWFVVPKFQYHATSYALSGQRHPVENRPTRYVPIGSLDAGLVFERDTEWFDAAAIQTLEPRLYYSYIPYRDQNTLPNFDSALADFNFAQLFTENVFTGGDRIGEANQATLALVGRVLDARSGAEGLRVALGQRYFFAPQRVALPGSAPRTDKESDVLASIVGVLGRSWSADVSMQHSTLQKKIVRATVGLRYQPRPASVLSMAYRYKVDEINQVDLAAQWPLAFVGLPQWYGVMRINHSQRESRIVESLAGFEYKANCWVLRLVGQRFVTAEQTATTTVFVQIELSGLSSVGSSPVESLKRNIPGYQLINTPARTPGQFDYYE